MIRLYGKTNRQLIFTFENRQAFEKWLYDLCVEQGYDSDNVRNILPQYSLKQNIRYSGIRIARELGYITDSMMT